jgi:glucokinase
MESRRANPETALIGLDVGGTKTAAGVVLFPEGQVLCRKVIPTNPKRPGETVLREILDLSKELVREASMRGYDVRGIGLGVAELVDPDGKITSSQTIDWFGLPVLETFAEVAPVVIDSDVRAAALAEALLGIGKAFRTFVYVTVGTGISCCLVQDGKPHRGVHGNALVMGTAPLSTTCPQCGVRSHPVLEEFASGPAIRRRYCEATQTAIPAGVEVTDMAENRDLYAVEVVRTAGEALGVSIGFLVNILDPEAVVVGGGLGLDKRLYWQSMVESARAHIWADSSKHVPILQAQLAGDAGFIGAAAGYWKSNDELRSMAGKNLGE